jgi:ABC-type sugar transport system substrate-binding protein
MPYDDPSTIWSEEGDFMIRLERWALPAITAVFVAACTGAATPTPPAATATAATATATATTDPNATRVKIGFVTHVIGNAFIQQIIDGANAAAKDLNVDLQVTGPEGGDADAQLKAVQSLVAAGVQGVATSVPGTTMTTGLNEIIDSGIPVVQFNLLDATVKAPYVGERSTESGRKLGGKVLDKMGGASATGKAIIGNCFPGFPVLENRAKGVEEGLKAAAGVQVLGPFDVKASTNENYAAWEALLAANADAKGMVGLCAFDIASLGKLQAANPDKPFVSGGYDLPTENLAEIKAGNAYVSLGQMPFMQGYLPVKILADTIRGITTVDLKAGGFIESGTEIVTADSVTEPYNLPALTFAQLEELAASPDKTRAYYQPLVENQIANWPTLLEPIANESK